MMYSKETLPVRYPRTIVENGAVFSNRNRNLQTSEAVLECQMQDTNLFTSAASNQRGLYKVSQKEGQVRLPYGQQKRKEIKKETSIGDQQVGHSKMQLNYHEYTFDNLIQTVLAQTVVNSSL